MVQISLFTPGQERLALRMPQIEQVTISSIETSAHYSGSWKWTMRTNLFIKVIVEHDHKESPEKLGAELCRQLEKNYIVRDAELSSFSPVED
jgi:hypothetical protein